MLVDFTRKHALPADAVLEAVELDNAHYTLRLNQAGLAELFGRTYAASNEETESPRPWINKRTGETIPPKRREPRTTTTKSGQPKVTEVCIYDRVVPHAGPLVELVPPTDDGRWIRLWREWLWSTLRAIPKQRTPYEQRARGGAVAEGEAEDAPEGEGKDVRVAWDLLAAERTTRLASTYYLGAMDVNAEGVPFQDRGRFLFLLHFWPFAIHVFTPRTMDAMGKLQPDGFVACIPDVARLQTFVERHQRSLRGRSPEADRVWRGRPRQGIVDLPDAAVLESDRWLHQEVRGSMDQADARATAGFQVVHTVKEGNNVRIRSNRILAPRRDQVDASRIVENCRSHLVKHQVLTNVLEDRPWWHGFERACATRSWEHTFDDNAFRQDSRTLFAHFHPEQPMADPHTEGARSPRQFESLVLHVVQTWLAGRLESKHSLRWSDVKDGGKQRSEYDEKKKKLASDAFLAARSRPGREFARWFTATLCSVTQRLTEDEFIALARALDERPDQVRSLTLLALSARG